MRAALLLGLIAFNAQAADENIDLLLEGFDEPTMEESAATVEPPKPHTLGGSAALGLGYTLGHPIVPGNNGPHDVHGLSRARVKLNLELDYRFDSGWKAKVAGSGVNNFAPGLNGRRDYTTEYIDDQTELELGEVWLAGSLHPSVDLKLGRQIVVWGKSDSLRVTDVINPLDSREPGMVDIEDLRLPVTMAKVDAYVGEWGLSLMAIPEVRLNKTPVYGSEFYPAPAPMTDTTPAVGGENTEYAAALKGEFSGWDLSLYRASFLDDVTPHTRRQMSGAAANWVSGNWLLKAEAARIDSRDDILLGFEYSGLRDTTLALEAVERDGGQRQLALRYSGELLHARLKPTVLIGLFDFGINNGGFARLAADYELADGLGLSGGVMSYWDGDGAMGWGENDRIFAEIKYSF